MRVLHLVTSLDFGGLEKRMEILAEYPSAKHEMVFCALSRGGAAAEKMKSMNARVDLLEQNPRIFSFSTFIALYRYILSTNPDILHTHGAEANFYGLLVGKLTGIEIRVAEEIGIPNYSNRSAWAYRLIFLLSHSVIAMSPAVKHFLVNKRVVGARKITTVFNPVLMPKVQKDLEKPIKGKVGFCFLGRLEKVKNPDGLLRAFKRLIEEGLQTELSIVGDGKLRADLDEFIQEEKLTNFVKIYGHLREPFSVLVRSEVIVQSSHTEGFSLALAEGMGAGLVPMSTPVGGSIDLIVDDKNGWLLRGSDDESIYKGLKCAIINTHKLRAMGRLAVSSVKDRFDAKLYAEALDNYYDHVFDALH